jgi:uncharacterized protein
MSKLKRKPTLVGRKEELEILDSAFNSYKSEFVILYGRRRVGKTFLINQRFNEHFTFRITGLANATLGQQLTNFQTTFNATTDARLLLDNPPKNWLSAFQYLIKLVAEDERERKVIFFDELPWFDTHGSDFLIALEHFWNSWASYRTDILLIGCGSAASWMVNQLIHNHGGLHNRVTQRIVLQPFTLSETEKFLKMKGGVYDRYQLAELYMAIGGIPFYLENIQVNRSIAQNIDRLFFTSGGLLNLEYYDLFRSLFNSADRHIAIIEALTQKAQGMTRKELLAAAKLKDGGSSTRVLEELEHSGFIKRYLPFGKAKRDALYQLIDQYTLFYHAFVKDSKAGGEGAWLTQMDSPKYQAWSGYAFESLCAYHIASLKNALKIAGIYTEISAWRSTKKDKGAQIDLIIDRADRIITICEMKFSTRKYTITKDYADKLQHKIWTFKEETATRKTVFLAMVTAHGLEQNQYSMRWVQESLDLDALFL